MAEIMQMPQLAATDRTIGAAVKGLCASRDVSRRSVAASIGVTERTFMRRFAHGGWTATEVDALARYFGCTVADLYAGRINATPPRGPQGPDGLPRLDSNQKPPD
ncbi:MAG: helix-turn-helix domain-containing protein [Candidatus Nanopelagicales bacterium]